MPSMTQPELPLTPPPFERTLEFTILRALGDPGVAPCPVCRGHLQEVPGGVACEGCGSEILLGVEDDDHVPDNVVFLDPVSIEIDRAEVFERG